MRAPRHLLLAACLVACRVAVPSHTILMAGPIAAVPVMLGPQLAIGEATCATESHVPEGPFATESGAEGFTDLFASVHRDAATSSPVVTGGGADREVWGVAQVEGRVDIARWSSNTPQSLRGTIALSGVVVRASAARAAARCGAQAPFVATEAPQ